ncbi:hypothetical protein MNEG_10344 [Monoraphidium neglectum]|uniref:Uncharacterized protein n=1 Tax=Monoraphidium neglectum TaxID=145388 RepID=A0A0D2JDI8_9CHLO|nr:hypothetical protein MNEG_10344 [Monoraphidium neglectum]KIY97617.1 hypothetical protein MNEG_10344 [Monoraphidium neglectum]|eukprot:XP_013896637.1 hypothetical protein MNEG_10344 [Monoraphidium neglectum]
MHSHGVLKFPSKDRYEGQFEQGLMDGYGVYVWADGTIYRGDWVQGRMHGCGVKIWRRPDGGIGSQEGKFLGDEFVGPVMPCSKDGAFEAAVEADMASYQARSFQVRGRW